MNDTTNQSMTPENLTESEVTAILAAKSDAIFSKFLDKSEYKMVIKIDCSDLEELVMEFFGYDNYEMVAEQEWDRDSIYEFDVDGSDDDIYTAQRAYKGEWSLLGLSSYLNEMRRKNALPTCKMIVRTY